MTDREILERYIDEVNLAYLTQKKRGNGHAV